MLPISIPTPPIIMPTMRSECAGVKRKGSNPYVLCHQKSIGAAMIWRAVPNAAMLTPLKKEGDIFPRAAIFVRSTSPERLAMATIPMPV